MKRTILPIFLALLALTASAQLPQFTSDDYESWTYSNPNIPLSPSTIAGGRVVFYVNSLGVALTLTSSQFNCQGINKIDTDVIWYTKYFNDNKFDLDKATLTLVIEDGEGHPLDSVTCVPTTPGISTHYLSLSLPVPTGLTTARLRFVSWTGDVISSGGIKSATFTASGTQPGTTTGDVNGNSYVDISDVTILIDYLLNGSGNIQVDAADVDHDGNASISDITALIDILLGN